MLSVYFCFFSCHKTSTEPDDNTSTIGYQKEIHWPTLADSPWPMFQQNPQGTGRSRFMGPQKGIISKTINLDSGSDLSFIVTDNNKNYYCAIGNYWADSTGRTDAYLFSYDFQGNQNWYVNIDGRELFSSPLIDKNGVVFIGSTEGIFYAVNSNGSLKWAFDAGFPITSGYGGATIGLDGTIYFSTRNALNAISQEGQLLWLKSEYGDTPIVLSPDGSTLYVKHISEGLDALDLNGNLMWQFHFSTESWMFHPIVDSNGRIYLFTDRNTVTVIDNNGKLEWQFSINQYMQFENDNIDQTTAPTLDKLGNFYFTTRDDLYSIDYSGELRWIIRGMGSAGSPLLCDNDDNIYLTKALGGDIFSISKKGILNWKINLNCSEMITCSPAICSDSKLIIMTNYNNKSLLYFIE